MSNILKRKLDNYLLEWKKSADKKPLIVKGARQIGKTASIDSFARNNYKHVVKINFVEQPRFKTIFDDGYEVESITKNLSLLNPSFRFVKGQTLIFFDEMQACPSCATSLKFFCLDGRFDVVCSGSLMGIHYHEIESNSVGYKVDYDMHSMDFEEFLWALGYGEGFINLMLDHMLTLSPFSQLEYDVLLGHFRDYMVIGGMPEVVRGFVEKKNFSGALQLQRQLLRDYEEDITKYAEGFDKGKVKGVYNHIPVVLARENKKFMVTKIARNARNRDYIGCVEWLADAGVINPCYCLNCVELPLGGNYDATAYKLYYKDTGLLIAALDEEAQEDLRANKNFGVYKGAIYENIVGDMLVKQAYKLYYYKSDKPSLEMDFFVRDTQSLIPIEVKASNNATASLNRLIDDERYPDVRYGIRFCNKNIGFNGRIYTLPYFTAFLLRQFLREKK